MSKGKYEEAKGVAWHLMNEAVVADHLGRQSVQGLDRDTARAKHRKIDRKRGT